MEKKNNKKGVILIVSAMILGLLLILGAYFLNLTLTESKISKSQNVASQAYYLAEAGVNEAIWKLKNDATWKDSFETMPGCVNWTDSFTKSGSLFPDSSYQVVIQNSECASGEIISTATINLPDGKTAQRVIKTQVFKAIGSLTAYGAIFTGGSSQNIDVFATTLNVHDGNLFSNNHINIKAFSTVNLFDDPSTPETEGKTLAVGNLDLSWDSNLSSVDRCAKNICQGDCATEGCPPAALNMPMVDFDSADPNSYKSKAIALEGANQCSVLCNGIQCGTKCVYTSSEFSDLLWQVGENGELTLDSEITYVTGSISLKGARRLMVNGALVADGTIDIGENDCWTNNGDKDCGFNSINVTDPGVGKPSGILTKTKINFGPFASFTDIEVVGIIYANDEIRLVSLPHSFEVVGGFLARKFSLTSAWSPVDIYLDNLRILEGVWAGPQPGGGGTPPYSPVVTIGHWEEAY